MARLIIGANELLPGTQVITENGVTITPKDGLEVLLDIDNAIPASVTLDSGISLFQKVHVMNKNSNACFLIYQSQNGTISISLNANQSAFLVWAGEYWNATFVGGYPGDYNPNIMATPKDITAYYSDGSLFNRIHGIGFPHKYYGIRVGDYWDCGTVITATESSTTGTSWITIAGCNSMRNRGYNSSNVNDYVSYDHIVCVPGRGEEALCFGNGQMYASTPFTGGYQSSKMAQTILPSIDTQLTAIFDSHLKSVYELLSNANNSTSWNRLGSASGTSTNWSWVQKKTVLLSEQEVFGSISASSSEFDTGTGNSQLPLFFWSSAARFCRSTQQTYWLKDVASGSHFSRSAWNGNPNNNVATNANGVRQDLLVHEVVIL